MSKDKDLEAIKNGDGLAGSSVTNCDRYTSGITTEQRGQQSGVRYEIFSYQEKQESGEE